MEETTILKVLENPWIQRIITKLFTKGKAILGDLSEKERIRWGKVFENYLKKTNENFSKTKTLLYRNIPVDIYEFYECIFLEKREKISINTQKIANVLNEGHKILITGLGGVGKTILMKHLFLNTIKTTEFIPVLIELRRINGKVNADFNLHEYIVKLLQEYGLSLSEKYYDYTFDEGYYVFLFDGYDEVEDKLKIVLKEEITKFSFKYNKNYFIISSRPLNEFISWENFLELKSLHLNKEQAISMIKKLKYDDEVKERFSKTLENGLFENYYTFASIPLLLLLMLLTYEETATIPSKLNEFYEQAFSVLFNKHDATKGLYIREIRTKLSYENFKKAFSYFCFSTYFRNKYSFSHSEIIQYIETINFEQLGIPRFKSEDFLEDLIVSLCLILEEGINYRFVHRSFQEYFSAVYFKELPDEQQKEFFILCMNNEKLEYADKFYSILLEIQKDRFMQNIVSTYLEITKNEMNKNMKYKSDEIRKVCLYFFKEFSFRIKRNNIKSIKLSISRINKLLFFIKILEINDSYGLQIEEEFYAEIEKILKIIYKNDIKIKELTFYELFNNDEFWSLFDKKYIKNIYFIWKKLENFYKKYKDKYKKNLVFYEFLNKI